MSGSGPSQRSLSVRVAWRRQCCIGEYRRSADLAASSLLRSRQPLWMAQPSWTVRH